MAGAVMLRPCVVDDIGSDEQLVRYAAKTQVAQLVEGTAKAATQIKQVKIAEAMDLPANKLAGSLNGSARVNDIDFLSRLDAAIFAYAPSLGEQTGGLAAFAARMRGSRGADSAAARIPSGWTKELLDRDPSKPVGVL